ncbi:MAG TPA: lipopolysaccharide heptosyltransferase II [Dehalococcoidia bacterium]|nr:lipopolysaccharide heptosyltransferase II [Dehalococcoidia bacterium]
MDENPLASWEKARHILCVRLDAAGDVLMTSPAIRAVRESAPERRVTLLTSSAGAEAAKLLASVDEVIPYQAPWVKGTTGGVESDLRMLASLRRRCFDAAIIFTVYSQNPLPAALLTYLAGVPLRLARCRENPYELLTTWLPEEEPAQFIRHEVQRQLDLVAAVGCATADDHIRLDVPCASKMQAQRSLAEVGIDGERPWIVVHPGASAPSRRYPPEAFAHVVESLVAEGLQVALTGSPAEVELVETVRSNVRDKTVSFAGRLGLSQLAALIAEAPLLLTNNTGPAHIAAGVATPVVVLYALTNPQHQPWRVPCKVLARDVPCKYCYKSVCPEGHHACLRGVHPEEVVSAVLELLDDTIGLRNRREPAWQV